MFNKNSISNSQMEMLLKIASQKMGISTNELKSKMENGNINEIFEKANVKNSDMSNILNNTQMMENLMNSKEAKELFKNLNGGK